MIKKTILLLLLPFCLQADDFLQLMGKGHKCWNHIRTKEDRENLEMFKESYEAHVRSPTDTLLIPEIIHFVWLGPKDFPQKSEMNLASWIEHHPHWKVKLWTDRPRELPFPEVEIKVIDPTFLGKDQDLFEGSDNWGEKSDILRLVILEKEGGLYVDHDVICRKSFAEFHKTYDFYTSLLFPGKFALDTPLVIRNSIIGIRPDHEVLEFALGLMRQKWKAVGDAYPGQDFASVEKRVIQRSFAGFHYAVCEALQDPSFSGIVFPAGYFTECDKKFGLYANEEISGSWYRGEMTYHEKMLEIRVHKLMNRFYWFLAISSICITLNFLLLIYVIRLLSKRVPRRA